jgi:hypothetical protein
MNADAAMAFVRRHGIVLVSAKGSAPRLTEAIAGEHHLTAYPAWVPAEILAEAERLTVHDAEVLLKDFISKRPANR